MTAAPIRVLLVDDTADFRMLLRLALSAEDDIEVVDEAGDGRAAVDAAGRLQPDVVLLDLAMPVMDGWEALPLLRTASPGSQVVVLSGFAAASMSASVLAAGAADYLQKGVSPDTIIDCVRRVVRPGAPAGSDDPLPVDPRKQVFAYLRRKQAEPADEAARIRDAVAAIAHEIRNPVSTLMGIAQTLGGRGDQISPEVRAGLLAAVERQAKVLDRVTGDLLAASQAGRGTLLVDVSDFLLLPALEAAVAGGRPDVVVHCAPGLTVCADPVRVDQMLSNLLSNAEKYGAPPVVVTAAQVDGLVSVEVADRGAGVPPEFRKMLFAQFARAPGSTVAGSGIGLFLVRALAEAQGGTAFYEPREGGGSRFGFSLPTGAV